MQQRATIDGVRYKALRALVLDGPQQRKVLPYPPYLVPDPFHYTPITLLR